MFNVDHAAGISAWRIRVSPVRRSRVLVWLQIGKQAWKGAGITRKESSVRRVEMGNKKGAGRGARKAKEEQRCHRAQNRRGKSSHRKSREVKVKVEV